MSIVVKMPTTSEQRERRLHLREVSNEQPVRLAGAVLREKRIELGIDEKSIAQKLKMRMDQLRAIEQSDYAKLPARTYAVGFVRAYAKSLGLDAETLVDLFKTETQSHDSSKPAELNFPEVAPAPKWPSGGIVVVALVVAIVIYGVAQLTMPGAEQSKTASVEENPVAVVDATDFAIKSGTQVSDRGAITVTPALPGTHSIFPVMGNEASVTEHLVDGLGPSISSLPPAPVTESPPQSPLASVARAPENSVAASRITLKAVEATYVQVKDLALRKPKSVLLARVMNPGESFQAPDRANLVLLTGNAGGIQVEVDGRSAGVLGKSGQVIKRLSLDPAYFLSRVGTSR